MAYWYLIPIGMELLGNLNQAEAQKAQAEAQSEQLRLEAEAGSLAIDRELNDALENQALVGSQQGRTGGTLSIIAEDSQRRAEVDKSLLRLNATAQGSALKAYGSSTKNAGVLGAIGNASATAISANGY